MAKTTPAQFARQVRQETAKIIWPSRRETVITTITVFVMVTFASLFLFIADQIIAYAVRWILGLGA
jgi:preprotein translocase subunit SecE